MSATSTCGALAPSVWRCCCNVLWGSSSIIRAKCGMPTHSLPTACLHTQQGSGILEGLALAMNRESWYARLTMRCQLSPSFSAAATPASTTCGGRAQG